MIQSIESRLEKMIFMVNCWIFVIMYRRLDLMVFAKLINPGQIGVFVQEHVELSHC